MSKLLVTILVTPARHARPRARGRSALSVATAATTPSETRQAYHVAVPQVPRVERPKGTLQLVLQRLNIVAVHCAAGQVHDVARTTKPATSGTIPDIFQGWWARQGSNL